MSKVYLEMITYRATAFPGPLPWLGDGVVAEEALGTRSVAC